MQRKSLILITRLSIQEKPISKLNLNDELFFCSFSRVGIMSKVQIPIDSVQPLIENRVWMFVRQDSGSVLFSQQLIYTKT